jgi:spore coat protein U-like protein
MLCLARLLCRLMLLLGSALTSVPALAQAACAVSGSGSVNFLTYNPASATATLASAVVTLTCTYAGSGGNERIDWSMQLTNGNSNDCNARRLAGPSDALNYNIYQNSVGGGVWGNLACATYPSGRMTVGPGVGNSSRSVSNTLYGQIPTGQFVSAGTYTDLLVLTVSY